MDRQNFEIKFILHAIKKHNTAWTHVLSLKLIGTHTISISNKSRHGRNRVSFALFIKACMLTHIKHGIVG